MVPEEPALRHGNLHLSQTDHGTREPLLMTVPVVEPHRRLPSQPLDLSKRVSHQPGPDGVDQMGVRWNQYAPLVPHDPLVRLAPLEIHFSPVQVVPYPLLAASPFLSSRQLSRQQGEAVLVGRSSRSAPSWRHPEWVRPACSPPSVWQLPRPYVPAEQPSPVPLVAPFLG